MNARSDDPRFASFPARPGVDQLRWYIRQTAAGVLTVDELLRDFRALHETVERSGNPEYHNPEEARAVWDVLWAVEFCSPDPAREDSPEDWYIPAEVLVIVRRAAEKLPPG